MSLLNEWQQAVHMYTHSRYPAPALATPLLTTMPVPGVLAVLVLVLASRLSTGRAAELFSITSFSPISAPAPTASSAAASTTSRVFAAAVAWTDVGDGLTPAAVLAVAVARSGRSAAA